MECSKIVKIIAEIGINHDGSFEKSSDLINASAEAGVWAVKFQYRNIENAYAKNANQIGDEILKTEIVKTYIPPPRLVQLAQHAKNLGLAVGISFFSPEDMLDFDDDIDIFDIIKVPSSELTNIDLIRKIEEIQKYGLISTGAYDEAQIASTLKLLRKDRWTPLHCVSNYPVSMINAKLGYLKHLSEIWDGPVAFQATMIIGKCVCSR